jgi:hypothetical protein
MQVDHLQVRMQRTEDVYNAQWTVMQTTEMQYSQCPVCGVGTWRAVVEKADVLVCDGRISLMVEPTPKMVEEWQANEVIMRVTG